MTDNIENLKIRDVFDKEREPLRRLDTIIKVNDISETSIWQEFEEFVVTESLLNYLIEFYNDFSSSIDIDEPKMPFWLEGFYGSGKSHFSKIIGLLYQNGLIKSPDGKTWKTIDFFIDKVLPAIEYNTDKLKNKKNELINSLKIFPNQINCKTLFINLSQYSKSEKKSDDKIESFMFALLKEFNISLGLSVNIETAELEKNLIQDNEYEKFKEAVYQNKGKKWEEIRKNSPKARIVFQNIYPKISDGDKQDAIAYFEGVKSDCYQKNITDVLLEINNWAEKNLNNLEKGIIGKYLIILDEAGFFFTAKVSRIGEMMAAAEWINNPGKKSRINMIFNAQQNIKTYLESVKTNVDYRTAEQRFKHWFLDKKNIKTVVVKRWLKKDEGKDGQKLEKLIDHEYPKIIDGAFLDTVKDPNLDYIKPTRKNIIETYPFLPYQFPLMIQISQKLITEKIVEEQFGGKTRSILSMTRDVLNNKSLYSNENHFVDENLGDFVNLSQIYDCITLTLKTKDEDQFLIVENTKKLVEDPSKFDKEEIDLPISFIDVAKTILLLKYVDEVYTSDYNIEKSLFYSLNLPKTEFHSKIHKLIDILKKKGIITYRKREIEDDEGNKKEIWEYKIASEEEQKYLKKTHHISINNEDIQECMRKFFSAKTGSGRDLITFKEQLYLQKLKGRGDKEYKLLNNIRIKPEWYLDPDLDEILGKITQEPNSATISVLTNQTLIEYKENLIKLRNKIQILIKKAKDKNKILLFIIPSLSQTIDSIISNHDVIIEDLKECIRIEETIKKEQMNMPPFIQQSFQRRINDIEKDILSLLSDEFDDGFIFYGDKTQANINKNNINNKILEGILETYSQINKYAYLGQVKPTSSQILSVLKWDPKKKSEISNLLKFTSTSSKSLAELICIFDENGQKLEPNKAEQYSYVIREFENYLKKNPHLNSISGEKIQNIFKNPPYSWNDQTILVLIASLIRNNEWDVLIGNIIKAYDDKEIIIAFQESKGKYQKFQNLSFSIAERLSQIELNQASDILNELFNELISQKGPDSINISISKVLKEFYETQLEVKDDFKNLNFKNGLNERILILSEQMHKILEISRPIQKIKQFIEIFNQYIQTTIGKDQFNTDKKHLYRIQDLKNSNKINRYYNLNVFLTDILNGWLSTQINLSNLNDLKMLREKLLNQSIDPRYLYENEWNELWKETGKLWQVYWESYKNLHEKLSSMIEDAINSFEKHQNYSRLKKNHIDKLRSYFDCKQKINIPKSLENNQFICQKCKNNYNTLQVFENRIKSKIDEIRKIIEQKPGGITGPRPGPRPSSPSKEEQDIWQEYMEFHEGICRILDEIKKQKTIYATDSKKLKIISIEWSKIKKKYPNFIDFHKCSVLPEIWEIDQQACNTCKKQYDELISIKSELTEIFENLLKKLIDTKVELPFSSEISIELSKDGSDLSEFKNQIVKITNILNTLEKQESINKRNIKIRFSVEKGD